MIAYDLQVAVYVSLNPFLLRIAEIEELISLMTSGFIIVPIVVFPWLITKRLEAKIDGPVKDYYLHQGIRSRLLRTFLALGTLMIFVRNLCLLLVHHPNRHHLRLLQLLRVRDMPQDRGEAAMDG